MVKYKLAEEYTNVIFRVRTSDLVKFDIVADERRTSRAALMRESMLDKIAQYERTTQEVKA